MNVSDTRRWLLQGASLLLIAIGIALVTRANMGTVAVMSPAYVLSGIHGQSLTFGLLALIMQLFFVALQCILLRTIRGVGILAQVLQAVASALMLDLCMWAMQPLQWDGGVAGYSIRLFQILVGSIVLGVGFSLHLKTDIQLSADGLSSAFAKVLGLRFTSVRLAGDLLMLLVAVVFCVFYFGDMRWDMIGLGSLISMAVVWFIFRKLTDRISLLSGFLMSAREKDSAMMQVYDASDTLPLVVTIARTHGSGGHEIGKLVAGRLGVKFYDKDIMASMATSEEFKYETQARIIQEVSKESCVIIGRCADYVLKDRPYCLNIFIRCDEDYAVTLIRNKDNLSESQAREVIRIKDNAREKHYNHSTGKQWKDPLHYDLVINTAKIGMESAVDIICNAVGNILKDEAQ